MTWQEIKPGTLLVLTNYWMPLRLNKGTILMVSEHFNQEVTERKWGKFINGAKTLRQASAKKQRGMLVCLLPDGKTGLFRDCYLGTHIEVIKP